MILPYYDSNIKQTKNGSILYDIYNLEVDKIQHLYIY